MTRAVRLRRRLGGALLSVLPAFAGGAAAACPAPDLPAALEAFPQSEAPEVSGEDPSWPLAVFIDAEAHRARGEHAAARRAYRSLVEWAGKDGDGWGGTSLAPFALWRLLGYALQGGGREAAALLERADVLLGSRFFRALGLNGPGREALLPALPDLESSIAERMLELSLTVPGHERLGRDFNTYLNLTMDTELTAAGERAMQLLYGDSQRERERLDLFRARRLIALREFDAARAHLESAYASSDLQISAAAGLLLARHTRFDRPLEVNVATLSEVIDIAAKPEQMADALLLRARYHGRIATREEAAAARAAKSEQAARDAQEKQRYAALREAHAARRAESIARFERDLRTLPRRTRSRYHRAEALYRLANHERLADPGAGLEAFARLRELGGDHHRVDSAHYLPALTHLRRGRPADLTAAAELLAELNRLRPEGPYFLHSLFWRGRIAEWQGRAEDARDRFAELSALDPVGYFGLRARMHLAHGPGAARRILPGPELETAIAEAYRRPQSASPLAGGPYHRRLEAALECGLYRAARAAEAEVQDAWPGRRLETLTVTELDTAGLLPGVALLLAMRQDALAAADAGKSAANMLAVAENVGLRAGEWNLAMFLAQDSSVPQSVKTARQHLPHYLAMAYPSILIEPITAAAARHAVPPGYLYALMRNESRFLPNVISAAGAVGLIQMLPATLENLAVQGICGVPELPSKPQRIRYLADPQQAIPLGACWLRRELLDKLDERLQDATIAHNAGLSRLYNWREEWRKAGVTEDLELTLELVAYGSTRAFTRRVMRDYLVVNALDPFTEAAR